MPLSDEELRPSLNAITHLDPVVEASLYIQDALTYSTHTHPRPGELYRKLHLVHLYLKPFVSWGILALVTLTFFELPHWCASVPACRDSLEWGHLTGNWASERALFPHNQTAVIYPLFGLPIAPSWVTSLLELLILTVLLVELLCNLIAQGFRRFMLPWKEFSGSSWSQPVYAILLTTAWADTLVRAHHAGWAAGYIAAYMRIALLCVDSPKILAELRLVRNTLRPLSGTAIVLGAFILFTAWVGILLFASRVPGSQGAVYFTSLFETAWQLFILFTTANFPDVMMPAYTTARFSFVFFFSFVALGTFFLCNVVIAVVCNEYNSQVEREEYERTAFRKRRLEQAFLLLDERGDGHLSRPRIEMAFKELNHYKMGIENINADKARVIFAALDSNRDSSISLDDFRKLCNLLEVRFRRIDKTTFITRVCPEFWSTHSCQVLEHVVRHRFFEYGIDLMLIINAVFLVVEDWRILMGDTTEFGCSGSRELVPNPPVEYGSGSSSNGSIMASNVGGDPSQGACWMQSLEVGFAGIFCCEMALKLAALGWYEYISSTANCFDGTVTVTSGVVALVTLIDNEMRNHNDGIVRYVIAMRLARFLRLLGLLPQVSLVVDTFVRMLPAAGKLLKVLFVTMFVFSTLGTQLFGGLINFGPQYEQLQNSMFGRAGYYPNNFNDHASGMVVCFELLVVNNWHILDAGFYAVASNGFQKAMVRLFFIIVYVFGVLVCLNIVIAFSIDSYNDRLEAYIDRRSAMSAAAREINNGANNGGGEEQQRGYSESIDRAATQFKPVVPLRLKKSDSLKKSLRNLNAAAGSGRQGSNKQAVIPPLSPTGLREGSALAKLKGSKSAKAEFNPGHELRGPDSFPTKVQTPRIGDVEASLPAPACPANSQDRRRAQTYSQAI